MAALRAADERAKTEAKAKERCDNARRALERSTASRAELNSRASTAERIQKADLEVGRREADVARECGR